MTMRIERMTKIGVAVALACGAIGSAAAQTTTRSDRVIRVTKDAAGDVVRVDTITVYKTDTLRIYRTDTMRVNVNVPGPTVTNTVTVTRYDTVTVDRLPDWMHQPRGWYIGVAGGSSLSNGAIHEAQGVGPAGQIQIGVDPNGFPLGLRFDINANRPDQSGGVYAPYPHGTQVNFNADLKLRTGQLSRQFPLSMYALGGGSYVRYRDMLIQLKDPTAGTVGDNVAPPDGKWHDKTGWNGGVGFAYGLGKREVFLEGRWIAWNARNTGQATQVPIMIGINWY